jgi:undecaprenyl-diphosphatase
MMDFIVQMDICLFREINGHWVNPVFDYVLAFVGSWSVMKWLFFGVILALLVFGKFRERVAVLLVLLCMVVGNPLVLGPLKRSVGRARPIQALDDVRWVKWGGGKPHAEMLSRQKGAPYSMPSAHVANNVTIWMVVVLVYGWRRWWWAVLWPLVMMLSRVYGGYHFPLDAVAGLVLGAAYTLLICHAANIIWRKYGRRVAPRLYDEHSTLFETSRSG